MAQSVPSDLVEINQDGYVVKTSKAEIGQKIPCPNNEMTFEKIDDSVKITLRPGMKVGPVKQDQ